MADEVAFLSPEWLDALPDVYGQLPRREGATAVVEHTVTGAPDGEVRYWTAYEDGRLASAGPGPDARATVTITTPYPLAADVAMGRVDPSAAFMQGRTKVAGDQAALLRVLALTATPDYRVATSGLADRTRI